MAKKEQNENRDEVLVVRITPVSDEWNVDADRRQPLFIISEEDAIKEFWKYNYEIYAICKSNGKLTRIKEWSEE